jgi:hypothetical protein
MAWWKELVEQVAGKYPEVAYIFLATTKEPGDGEGVQIKTRCFGRGVADVDLSDSDVAFVKQNERGGRFRKLQKKANRVISGIGSIFQK